MPGPVPCVFLSGGTVPRAREAIKLISGRLVSPGQLDRLHRGKEWDFPPTCGPQCASPGLSAIREGIWC